MRTTIAKYLTLTTLIILVVLPLSAVGTQTVSLSVPDDSNRLLQSTKAGDVSLPAHSFSISNLFHVNYEFDSKGFITIAIKCLKPHQYFSIGFGSKMDGADIWVFELENNEVVVSDRFGKGHSTPPRDTSTGGKDNLERLGYEITSSYTLVKVRRALNTGDSHDAVIKKATMKGIYATGKSLTMTYHQSTRGRTDLPFGG